MKQVEKTEKYYGIADCYGIESIYREGEPNAWPIQYCEIRANTNRQRHAILFVVDLSTKQYETIRATLSSGDPEMALRLLKINQTFRVPQDHVASVELIPNPKLDPYGPRTEVKA